MASSSSASAALYRRESRASVACLIRRAAFLIALRLCPESCGPVGSGMLVPLAIACSSASAPRTSPASTGRRPAIGSASALRAIFAGGIGPLTADRALPEYQAASHLDRSGLREAVVRWRASPARPLNHEAGAKNVHVTPGSYPFGRNLRTLCAHRWRVIAFLRSLA